MKKDLNKKQKNVLIGFLLAIVLVMAVGYAAFQTSLNITNTAQIDSKWNVQITNITANETATCSDSEDITTCSTTGNVAASYDNSNGLTATFAAALVSPGDSVTYTIEISNLGTLNAQLASIDLPAQSDPNITYVVNQDGNGDAISGALTTNSILNKKDTSPDKGYVYVTVKYKSYSGQVTPTGNAATVSDTIRFNFVQTTSSAPSGFTGTIYRNNNNILVNNQTMDGQVPGYCIVNEAEGFNQCDDGYIFTDLSDCQAMISTGDTCEPGTVMRDAGDYEFDASDLNKPIYLKHEIENDIVVATYVCFIYTGSEICLQGYQPSYYASNINILRGVESWFNNNEGDCLFDVLNADPTCVAGSFSVTATDSGYAYAADYSSDDAYCSVGDDGYSACD